MNTLIPKVSILTPAWNRATLLPKVFESLTTQTSQEFEWVVVDDGSEDNTKEIMKEILKKATFPVTFISYDKRVGKCRADNKLLDMALANKVLWCDSDDVLVPNTIEKMLEVWDSIPLKEQDEYIAVISLCIDDKGNIQSTGQTDFEPFSCTWNELSKEYGMTGDMCIMQNKTLIGDKRFLEVDLVMSESGFWKQFMDKKVKCISDPLKIMTRTTENRISGSSKMEYCRGKAHAIILADKKDYQMLTRKKQIQIASKLIRYSIHGDLNLNNIEREFGDSSKKISFKVGKLLGRLLAYKDQLQGRVYKSHLVFEDGKDATFKIFKNDKALKDNEYSN